MTSAQQSITAVTAAHSYSILIHENMTLISIFNNVMFLQPACFTCAVRYAWLPCEIEQNSRAFFKSRDKLTPIQKIWHNPRIRDNDLDFFAELY